MQNSMQKEKKQAKRKVPAKVHLMFSTNVSWEKPVKLSPHALAEAFAQLMEQYQGQKS